MKVSIFLPYYNDKAFIRHAIDSVLAQTYRDFELFLLNHASTDGSRDIARGYTDDRIRHIDIAENLGAGAGVNFKLFLREASGEFIKFMCADDELYHDAIERMLACADGPTQPDAVFGDCEQVDENGRSLGETIFARRERELKCDSLYDGDYDIAKFIPQLVKGGCAWAYPGALVRRSVFADIALDVSMVMFFDVSIWVELILRESRVAYVHEPVIKYRVHKGQVSSVSRLKTIVKTIDFEKENLVPRIVECGKVDLIRRAFSESEYSKLCHDEVDAKFLVCEWFLRELKSHVAYNMLCCMMNDDATRAHLEEKFGFTVRSLRTLYLEWGKPVKLIEELNWRKRIKRTPGSELGLFETAWLLLDKIWKTLTFRKTRKKITC